MQKNQAVFDTLRASYVTYLRTTAQTLERYISLSNTFSLLPEHHKEIIDLVHGVIGSGGTMGFPKVSAAANTLHSFLTSDRKHDIGFLKYLLLDLQQICENTSDENDTADNEEITFSQPATVLVIDDDLVISCLLRLTFATRNIKGLFAYDGKEALDILVETIPDLIILDIQMPNMGGQEVLKYIKNDARLKSVPVIMLTSHQKQKDIASAFDQGATDYILKPFKPEVLIMKIEELLSASSQKILIIENDMHVAKLLEQAYTDKGFKVLTAENGIDGWKHILSDSPDLIVLDWTLPQMDALAILKNLKADDKFKDTPVIILASKDENTSDEIGFYNIEKPFIPRDLIKRSMAILEANRQK